MTALHDLTLIQQAEALRKGEVKSTELTEHYLERIARYDGQLGAFVRVTADLAREEASRSDDRLKAGESAPLLGVPFAFKDLYFVAGVPISMGSAAIDPVDLGVDSHTVGLLRRAGVVTLGTTHTPELGAPCYTHSDVVGRPAVTPYDTGRYAGGSSGGAAAAVAAGLLPAGHGSDGAGSIRIPAAQCGLVGVKPSRGLVSEAPAASFLSWATQGPLARTVEDAALLLDVMADAPAGDLHRRKAEGAFLERVRQTPKRPLKVAVWTDNGLAEPGHEALQAVDLTAGALKGLGHAVEPISNPLPWTEALIDAFFDVFAGMAAGLLGVMVPPDRRDRLEAFTAWLADRGEQMGASRLMGAIDSLAAAASAILAAVDPYDVVLTPVTTQPPVEIGYFHTEGPGAIGRRMAEWAPYTPMVNLAGQPSVALPVHVTETGLPMAAQLTGRPGEDGLLLGLAGQLETEIGWQQRHPAQWNQ